jgi:hypothetical protein
MPQRPRTVPAHPPCEPGCGSAGTRTPRRSMARQSCNAGGSGCTPAVHVQIEVVAWLLLLLTAAAQCLNSVTIHTCNTFSPCPFCKRRGSAAAQVASTDACDALKPSTPERSVAWSAAGAAAVFGPATSMFAETPSHALCRARHTRHFMSGDQMLQRRSWTGQQCKPTNVHESKCQGGACCPPWLQSQAVRQPASLLSWPARYTRSAG